MAYPQKEESKSLYDYSDRSIPQAGQAAIVYGLISIATTIFTWFRAPSTPWIAVAGVALVIAIVVAPLAFGIFRKSRVTVVLMIVLVVGLQLYTWFVQHSFSGTILSFIVTGFLLRGAKRIFEEHRESNPTTI